MKFRSLTYTAPRRQQKLAAVPKEQQQQANIKSYQLWKRVNPGYFETEFDTSTRQQQRYDPRDYQHLNKETFRQRDRHTEYVEYAVRDRALARKNATATK